MDIRIDKGYTPDLLPNEIANFGGLLRANNVFPISGGYTPVRDKATYNSNAASGTPVRGYSAQSSVDGNHYNFLGTSTKLYRFDSSSMTDFTRSAGGAYTAGWWDFATYGNWIIATDFNDVPQVKKTIEDGTNFTALGGTPPNAKYCLMSHGHLIFGYLNYGGNTYPKKIMWSGKELPEGMNTASPTDLTTGADAQEFPELDGVITGLAHIGSGWAIFSESSITFASYIGGGYTFNFQVNAIKNTGNYYPGSLLSIGNTAFFWSRDAIWQLRGDGLKEICLNVKRTLFSSINYVQTSKITAWHEPENNLIIWAYTTSSSTSPDRMLVYNYVEERATLIPITSYCGMRGVIGGVVINDMTLANGYPVINSMGNLIDSYNSGDTLGTFVIDTDGKVKTFSGAQLTAELETGEVFDVEQVTTIDKVYVPIEELTGTATVTPKCRYSTIDSKTSMNPGSVKSDGSADVRVTNRRHSINLTVNGFGRIGPVLTLRAKPTGRR